MSNGAPNTGRVRSHNKALSKLYASNAITKERIKLGVKKRKRTSG